ncbi:MAG: BBE domain-containing protein [Methyloceanibacter sp.]
MQHVGSDEFTLVLYAYGGAIARTASPDTAFPYRNATCCIQYDLLWQQPAMVLGWLAQMQRLYAMMRPYVSGAAYVNYCDADLQNWREAYWGPNLPRPAGHQGALRS